MIDIAYKGNVSNARLRNTPISEWWKFLPKQYNKADVKITTDLSEFKFTFPGKFKVGNKVHIKAHKGSEVVDKSAVVVDIDPYKGSIEFDNLGFMDVKDMQNEGWKITIEKIL